MAVELAEVAAGLPMAAALALAGGLTTLREGRRRTALNEAMHELRRPLQVLSLSLPADAPEVAPVESSLQLARVALDRLDREINGVSHQEEVNEVSIRNLIEEAVRRWRGAVLRNGSSLELALDSEDICVQGDHFDLAQALDNLLSNAIEHGGGQVRIGWWREGDQVCVSVADNGSVTRTKFRRRGFRRARRCRRGHGLKIVRRIARRHGGSFVLRPALDGTEASLRLPLGQQVER
jgi:two-component system sensor histidine kinase MtrB